MLQPSLWKCRVTTFGGSANIHIILRVCITAVQQQQQCDIVHNILYLAHSPSSSPTPRLETETAVQLKVGRCLGSLTTQYLLGTTQYTCCTVCTTEVSTQPGSLMHDSCDTHEDAGNTVHSSRVGRPTNRLTTAAVRLERDAHVCCRSAGSSLLLS